MNTIMTGLQDYIDPEQIQYVMMGGNVWWTAAQIATAIFESYPTPGAVTHTIYDNADKFVCASQTVNNQRIYAIRKRYYKQRGKFGVWSDIINGKVTAC